jgi:hypothetical protein
MDSKIDNFLLIVGAMKCGTTSLYNYLVQHPEIAPCHTKEVNFFGNSSRFAKGFDFYQSLWDWNPQRHKYALEATPSYTRLTHVKVLNAAENIAQTASQTGAKFKFIYVLRNPVDRIESHYTQGRKYNYQDTSVPIEAGINREIIDTSRYAMQIKEYYQRFAAEDILLLNFEDLKRQPQLLLEKICIFLDIDAQYQFKDADIVHNSYSQKSTKVGLPGYSQLRKTNFAKNMIKFMPKDIKHKVKGVRNLLAREYKYDYVKLPPEQRAALFKELAPDLEELQAKYSFDVGDWKN